MKELKKYLDIDVLTAAKQRINHIIDAFDTILVCFSGGKDSLVVLSLVEEIYKERGINKKVKVIFRDEELIPDNVIDFVQEKYKSGKYDFRYYAIPLKSQKYVLGKTEEYIQWDENREWVRQPPEFAIRLPKGDHRVFSQYDADAFICKDEKGKVAMLTGIRSSESLLRFRSVVNKKNESYISSTKSDGIKLCKPIYDWSEQDVFLYFYQRGITYCNVYDEQTVNQEGLRVATPLHADAAKKFGKLKTRCPKFYQQVVNIFPEMLLQDRYYKEFNGVKDFNGYEHSIEGLKKFVYDTLQDEELINNALSIIRLANSLRSKRKPTPENKYCGYPLMYVFENIAKGQVKRKIILPCGTLKKEYIEFENS